MYFFLVSCANDSTTKFGLTYSYPTSPNNNGQIASIADAVDNGRSVSYTYDALNRLTSAATTGSTSYPNWHLTWAYDRFGNRLNQTVQPDTSPNLQPPPPSNLLSFANPGGAQTNRPDNMCFDASGNLMTETSVSPCPPLAPTYAYDAENKLVNYVGATPMYVYDGNGLRVKKCLPNCTSPTSSTVYVFSGPKVIAEYDNGVAPSSPSREYVYSGGALLAKIESGASIYYHPDHLSDRVLTDSGGNVLGQRGHYPFGETWYESGTTTKLKFTAYERDNESTNDYAIARTYINRFDRFSSPDPFTGSIVNPQSLNRYAYAMNSPVQNSDPLGLICTGEGSGPCTGGPGGGDEGNCTINGADAPCGLALGLISDGVGAQCPQNNCSLVAELTWDVYGNLVFVKSRALLMGETSGYTAILSIQFTIPADDDTFQPGSMAYSVFGPPSFHTWNGATNMVNAGAAFTTAGIGVAVAAPAAAAGAAYATGTYLAWAGPTTGFVIGTYLTAQQNYVVAAEEEGLGAFNLWRPVYSFFQATGNFWTANQAYIDEQVALGRQAYVYGPQFARMGSYLWPELARLAQLGVDAGQLKPIY